MVETIAQIGCATALGVILGVVYYCTKSLVGSILLHAFFDFAAIFTSAVTAIKAMPEDLSIVGLVIQWLVIFSGVFVAYKIWKHFEEERCR